MLTQNISIVTHRRSLFVFLSPHKDLSKYMDYETTKRITKKKKKVLGRWLPLTSFYLELPATEMGPQRRRVFANLIDAVIWRVLAWKMLYPEQILGRILSPRSGVPSLR